MIYFLTFIFKQLQCHSIYWAIIDIRAVEWVVGQPLAYLYVTRDANYIVDGMTR